MSEKDFFVGWDENTPAENKRALRRLLIPIFVGVPLLALVLVSFIKPFNDHKFELGNIKEFSGVLHTTPFPVLLMEAEESPMGEETSALLVGYGKNGAKTFLKDPIGLEGKRVRIAGTLIYGDGKTLIELTEKENSLLEVDKSNITKPEVGATEGLQLEGEILDPKCWFGVMKPAEGKVHKSCAIRCVSGGIEPVLRVSVDGKNTYYVLKGEKGQDINQEVLEFIAEPVTVKAKVEMRNGWNVAYVNPAQISYISN
ncbi:MAG: hypothetical protein AAGC47_05480 [Bacteroidota bacterium]